MPNNLESLLSNDPKAVDTLGSTDRVTEREMLKQRLELVKRWMDLFLDELEQLLAMKSSRTSPKDLKERFERIRELVTGVKNLREMLRDTSIKLEEPARQLIRELEQKKLTP